MVKKIIRSIFRRTRSWLQEDNEERSGPLPVEYSYRWLNHVLFPKVIAGGGRPHYTWGVLQGMNLARALGIPRVSIAEFGVAGGNGLVALEEAVERLEPHFGVKVDIYGFDTGTGLPKSQDYRDLPHVYEEGEYTMDIDKLKSRLTRSQLKLGLVEDTIGDFMRSRPAPMAFISIDLDYYHATMAAFRLLDVDTETLLPRIWCYCDDIMGPTKCDYTGERLAMADFNASHKMRKICPIPGLPWAVPDRFSRQIWLWKVFLIHIFDHEKYGQYDGLTPPHNLGLKS